jgi:hypothetical protein
LNGFKTAKKVIGDALGDANGGAFLTLQKRKVLNGGAFGGAFFVFFLRLDGTKNHIFM